MQTNTNPKEIKLSNIKPIVSRTDLQGKIKYCNNYFSEVSGFDESELLNASHNIVRHPEMPKVIFKLMWQRLKKNENILAIVKNRTKSGDYYWVTTLFETKYHPFDKTPEGLLALRKAAPHSAVVAIESLYKKLLDLEQNESMEASEKYLMEFLQKEGKEYDEYVRELVEYKGLSVKFFNAMRKMFA